MHHHQNGAVPVERRASRKRAAREGGASKQRERAARVDGASGRREQAARKGGTKWRYSDYVQMGRYCWGEVLQQAGRRSVASMLAVTGRYVKLFLNNEKKLQMYFEYFELEN